MSKPTIEHFVVLESSLPPEVAARRARSYLARLAKSPSEDDGLSGTVNIGSRLAYRLWGATSFGIRRLPIHLSWAARAASTGSSLSLTMTSDEGRYAFYTPLHKFAYDQRFRELTTALSEQLA